MNAARERTRGRLSHGSTWAAWRNARRERAGRRCTRAARARDQRKSSAQATLRCWSSLSPQLGSITACRLARPPHTITTNWSGRSLSQTRPLASTRSLCSRATRFGSGHSSIGCHACSHRKALRSSIVGERGGESVRPLGVHRDHDLPVAGGRREKLVRQGERSALGDEVEKVTGVVVVDVGDSVRSLGRVHGHDVVAARVSPLLRERRPRRLFLPLGEAHARACPAGRTRSSTSCPPAVRRCCADTATPCARWSWNRDRRRRPCSHCGSRCRPGRASGRSR